MTFQPVLHATASAPAAPHRTRNWAGGRKKGQRPRCSVCKILGHTAVQHLNGQRPGAEESVALALLKMKRGEPLPDAPLTETRRRLNGEQTPVNAKARAPGDFVQVQIAAMLAAGCTPSKIAHAFGLHADAVRQVISAGPIQQYKADFREAMKVVTLSRTIGLQEAAMQWAAETIQEKNSQDFDRVTRGIAQIEKVAASAAGENMPPTIQIANVNQTLAAGAEDEAKALVEAFAKMGKKTDA